MLVLVGIFAALIGSCMLCAGITQFFPDPSQRGQRADYLAAWLSLGMGLFALVGAMACLIPKSRPYTLRIICGIVAMVLVVTAFFTARRVLQDGFDFAALRFSLLFCIFVPLLVYATVRGGFPGTTRAFSAEAPLTSETQDVLDVVPADGKTTPSEEAISTHPLRAASPSTEPVPDHASVRHTIRLRCDDKHAKKGMWVLEIRDHEAVLKDPDGIVREHFEHRHAEAHFDLPSFWRSITYLTFKTQDGQHIWFDPDPKAVRGVKGYLDYAYSTRGAQEVVKFGQKARIAVFLGFLLIIVGIGASVYSFLMPIGEKAYVFYGLIWLV